MHLALLCAIQTNDIHVHVCMLFYLANVQFEPISEDDCFESCSHVPLKVFCVSPKCEFAHFYLALLIKKYNIFFYILKTKFTWPFMNTSITLGLYR